MQKTTFPRTPNGITCVISCRHSLGLWLLSEDLYWCIFGQRVTRIVLWYLQKHFVEFESVSADFWNFRQFRGNMFSVLESI